MSCCLEVVVAFLRREGGDQVSDNYPELNDGSVGGLSKQGLEFGEGQFDQVEFGGIGRQSSIDQERIDALLDGAPDSQNSLKLEAEIASDPSALQALGERT